MNTWSRLPRAFCILAMITFSFLLAPGVVSADSGREEPPEKILEQKQAAAERRLQASRDQVDEAFGAEEKSTFTPHNLNYISLGRNDALMQISFKYRLGRDWNTYLAFTNVIKWDVWESSSPYRDINFEPELFYRFTPDAEHLVSLDAGYWHKSNGRADEESRSWDQLYLRFNSLFDVKSIALAWETHLYLELNTGDFNQDIGDYLGWWDTGFYLLNVLPNDTINIDLEFFIWSGDNGVPFDRGQIRAGIIFKLDNAVFQPSLYLQYFNGYGEVMSDYDVRTEDFRVGIAFLY